MLEKENCRAVIMAGADISDYSFFTPLSGDYVICADRGYLHAVKLGVKPDVLLGDFDSLNIPLPGGQEILTYPAEKDETDLQIAIGHALDRGYRDILVIGAFGGRMDHFLGNVCLMKWTRERGGNLILEDSDTRMFLLADTVTLPQKGNRYLSVIPFFEDAVVSLAGVKYPADKAQFKVGDTLGISNEITSEAAKITVFEGSVLVLQCRADRAL